MDVCVDACLIIKTVVRESDSALALRLFEKWQDLGVRLIAPDFAHDEIDSILRKKVTRKELTQEKADRAFNHALNLPLQPIIIGYQRRIRAWELAQQLNEPHVHDVTYLALSEDHNCEFWTSDDRFFAKVEIRFRFVHHLSEISK